jgi:hypothetical protein
MELRELEAFGEPGAVVYLADCVELMRLMPAGSVDAVFADPPYRLSNGGVTVKSGRVDSVDKGAWDRSLGSFERDHAFNERWLREARRVLKPDGTIWVSGTHHVIFSLGFALQTLGFRVINSVAWEKPDPPPDALHTAFTHPKAVEPLLADASPSSPRAPLAWFDGVSGNTEARAASERQEHLPQSQAQHPSVPSRRRGFGLRCLRRTTRRSPYSLQGARA